MPRKNPVPEREQEIGRRLRTFRQEKLKMTAVAFAREIGIDSTRLSKYEHGRVPIPYAIARSACHKFDINQIWLAEGILLMEGYIEPSEGFEDDLRPKPKDSASVNDFASFV